MSNEYKNWLYFNPEEINSFYGINEFDCKLYLIIRKFMDKDTGITGIKRGISWKSLSEEMWIEPVRGSKAESGSPSEKKLRCAINRLEKKELVQVLSRERQLIFKCLLASQPQSAQMRKGRGRADMSDRPEYQENPINTGYSEHQEEKSGTPKIAKNGTPLLSNNNIINNIINPKKTKRAFPGDFTVTDSHRAFAAKNNLPSPDSEFEHFKDHHKTNGNKFLDWDATFRNWLRNAKNFKRTSFPTNDTRKNEVRQTVKLFVPDPPSKRANKEVMEENLKKINQHLRRVQTQS